ncbi:hypothetical protein LTR51_002997 [Lithohypha guttulata]|uniref:Cytochrome P450 n=1 Tax=Lithohypha guttulata TaxID=1690604 RepID=A0AAN7SXD7_9EURO|nr:hypothetical protein LTR51_002997 [Lithohypha guttulata]KAK5083178.1 hypothetical protein LTR05_007062 [Lithohypha guttulata]
MWSQIFIAATVCLTASLALYINDLLQKRRRLNGLPQPPMQNLLIGHLHIADLCRSLFPDDIHVHAWTDFVRERWNLPETFYVDWRPFAPLWLFSADPELVAEYINVKQNLPKSPMETGYLDKFLGKNNMVALEGERWKSLRSMFNPGFSASNIMTYADAIVEASLRFMTVLEEKARKNELFELEEYATRLTIDIIGLAVFDLDMDAQRKLHPIVHYFRERVLMMPPATAIYPWQAVEPLRPLRLWWNSRKLDRAILEEVNHKIVRRAKDIQDEAGDKKGSKKKSIIDLALNAYEKEISMSDPSGQMKQITSPKDVPKSLERDLIDTIKTFFFAGHENPDARKKLDEELNTVFPPGTSAAETIRKDPYIINKLEYTTAVVKETLRIFPPASTLRWISPQGSVQHTTMVNPRTGERFPLEGVHIWPTAYMIGRNKRFFPQPRQFIPERFIPMQTPFPASELFTPAGKYAFQAFSVGPRNCIGQELAMVESKIILALTAREIDFVLEYPGEEADLQPLIPESTAVEFGKEYEKGVREGRIKKNVVEGHRVYQTLSGSAKPNGHCPGRVYLRTQTA